MRWREVGAGTCARCLPQDPVGARYGRQPPSLLLPPGSVRPSSHRLMPVSVLLVSTEVEATRRARMGCVHGKDHYDHARFASSRRTMASIPSPSVRSPSSRMRNIQTLLQDEVHTCTMRSAYADSSRRPKLQEPPHTRKLREELLVECLMRRGFEKLGFPRGGASNQNKHYSPKLQLIWGPTMYHFDDLPFPVSNLTECLRHVVESKSSVRSCSKLLPSVRSPPIFHAG